MRRNGSPFCSCLDLFCASLLRLFLRADLDKSMGGRDMRDISTLLSSLRQWLSKMYFKDDTLSKCMNTTIMTTTTVSTIRWLMAPRTILLNLLPMPYVRQRPVLEHSGSLMNSYNAYAVFTVVQSVCRLRVLIYSHTCTVEPQLSVTNGTKPLSDKWNCGICEAP